MSITKPTPNPADMGLFGGTGAAIEESERQGGREMLASTWLPFEGSDDPALAMIDWGPGIADDPIFREATLPTGWHRESGDHPGGLWTYLVDADGKRRAAIFYKAAFYDRRAKIWPEPTDAP